MHKLIILPPAARFLKKLKEKPLKAAFQKAVDEILQDPYVGAPKTGDLSGVYGYMRAIPSFPTASRYQIYQ